MFQKYIILFLFAAGLVFAQLINVNPDPNGEAWLAGGLKVPEYLNRKQLDIIDPETVKDVILPSRVDNSEKKFFRPVFNQVGGSCSQAAGVGYTFTYEMNRLRDISSDSAINQYPTHFTYNFLNEGSGEIGSWWGDGWDIIESVGIMNVEDYGGHFATGGNSRWISGLEEWKNGHSNRISSYNAIEAGNPEGLNTLKHWLHNHLEDSEHGGLAVFAAGATGYDLNSLPEGTHDEGSSVITRWGTNVNHAMTFIGYDDSIRFDYNNDGKFTNDIDINGDGIVNMKDWEIGGLIVANSWGSGWGDSGKTYMMYKLLAEPYENGGIFWHFADVVHPVTRTDPRFTMEVRIKHEQRNAIRISAGYSLDLYTDTPRSEGSFPFINYQGGAFYPQGGRTEDDKYLDFSVDIDNVLAEIDTQQPFKAFFIIDEDDDRNQFYGEIISVAVVDNETGKKYYDNSDPVVLINDGRTSVGVIVDENTFVPEELTAFAGDGKIELDWKGSEQTSTSFTGYNIYRDNELHESDVNAGHFTDNNLENGRVYSYIVSAVFEGEFEGEIFSAEVQAMPSEPSELPYFTDFEEGNDGWILKDDLSGWLLGDTSYSSEYCDYTGNNTKFILANPDLAGNNTVVRDHAVSPVFNLSNYDMVHIDLDYFLFNESDLYYFCDISVMYRTGPGQEWILIENFMYNEEWTSISVAVPPEALLSNYTQFSFFMDDHYKWSMGGGGIDNVSITGNFSTSAPVITSCLPAEQMFSISDSEPAAFSVEVYDDDTGDSELDFKWYVNGELNQQGGAEFSKIFKDQGAYTVKVTVSDKYDEVSHEWTVTQTDIEENLPLSTKLYQNYPNPFNPSTIIRFDNATESFTVMKIFNSNGQLVRELMNKKLDPGSYSILWDGRDNSGVMLSSGIYYCTVRTENYSKTLKMMLFK